jgi:hypothetical protein
MNVRILERIHEHEQERLQEGIQEGMQENIPEHVQERILKLRWRFENRIWIPRKQDKSTGDGIYLSDGLAYAIVPMSRSRTPIR